MIPIEVIYFVPTVLVVYFVIGLCVKCSKKSSNSSGCFYSTADDTSRAVVLTATNGLNNSTAGIVATGAIKDGSPHTNGGLMTCASESSGNANSSSAVVTNALTLANPLVSPSPTSNRSLANGHIFGPLAPTSTPTPTAIAASAVSSATTNDGPSSNTLSGVDVNDLLNNGASAVSNHSDGSTNGEISYNKISVREPLSRVLAEQAVLEHTYIEVENESSGLVEDPGYEIVKTESEPGYEEIGLQSSHRIGCNITNGNIAERNSPSLSSNRDRASGISARAINVNVSPNVNHCVSNRMVGDDDDEYDDESLYHTYDRPEAVYSDPISSDPGYEAVRDWNHPPAHINVCNSPTNSTDGLCAHHAYAIINKPSASSSHHKGAIHSQASIPPPVSKTITVVRVNNSPSPHVSTFINSPDSSDSSTINDHAYAVINKPSSSASNAPSGSSPATNSTATASKSLRQVRLITPSNSLSDSSDDLSTDHVYAVINKPSGNASTSTTISTFNALTGTTMTSTIVSSTSPIVTTVTLNSSPPPPPPPLPLPLQPQPPPLPPLTPSMSANMSSHLTSQSSQQSPPQKRILPRGVGGSSGGKRI